MGIKCNFCDFRGLFNSHMRQHMRKHNEDNTDDKQRNEDCSDEDVDDLEQVDVKSEEYFEDDNKSIDEEGRGD